MAAGPVLFHPSGSLGYHLRAWRHRHQLWRPYHETVAHWLDAWRPATDHLVLVGPSAGYSLNADFLSRFARITALEPDPLARWLLRHRFASLRLQWDRALSHPGELPRRHPGAAYLFCNLIGQPLLGPGSNWADGIGNALADHPWASYHDLIATRREPNLMGPVHLNRLPPLDVLLAHFWHGGELELIDLDTHGLCPDSARSYVVWPLTPGEYHLVEWIAHI